MGASAGVLARMGIGATSTVDKPIAFTSESVKSSGQVIDGDGIRGIVDMITERTRDGNIAVGGGVEMNPGPVEITSWLPYIMNAAGSGTTFTLGESANPFYYAVNRVAEAFTYGGMLVQSARLAASEGGLMTMSVQMVGKTQTKGAVAGFPSLTLETAAPYFVADIATVIGGTTVPFNSFSLDIANQYDVKYRNSQTASDIILIGRTITVSLQTPYTSNETAIYNPGNTGAATTITLTNGGVSCVMTMPSVKFNRDDPTVSGRNEIGLSLTGMARKSGSTAALTIVNDSTP